MATTGEPGAEEPQEEQRQERLRVLDLSAVGLAFPIALLLGYFGGRAIGGWLGSAKIGALIGALVGIVGGFYNLFKMVSRLAPRSTASNVGPVPAAAAPPREPAELGPDLDDDEVLDDDLEDDDDLESADPDEG